VQLFVDRAQAVLPEFQVTEANAAAVAELCAGLEGLPLSLELAAARSGTLTPAQMVASLDERLALLVTRNNYRPERHRSMRAALECSVELLPLELRSFLSQLSVFRGGWTLEAAEEVCPEPLAAEPLAQLRDASLLVAATHGDPLRFRLLETMREFAAEPLTPEAQAGLRQRHAHYYLALAQRADRELEGPAQALWLDRLEADLDNFRTAFTWGLEAEPVLALDLAVALVHFFDLRGHWREGRALLERALPHLGQAPAALQSKALVQAGWLSYLQGDQEVGRERLESALTLSRQQGERRLTLMTLYGLAHLARTQERFEEARDLHEQGLALGRELGDSLAVARALDGLGDIAAAQQDYAQARRLYQESLEINRQMGSPRSVALGLGFLGDVEAAQGNRAAAERLYLESLELFREVGDKHSVASHLTRLGNLALRQGDLPGARARLEESLAGMRELGAQTGIANVLYHLGEVAVVQGDDRTARACLEESLEIQRQVGQTRALIAPLELLAEVALRQGEPASAVRHLGTAAALRSAHSDPLPERDQADQRRRLEALRTDLGEEAFDAAWEEGFQEQRKAKT
jgi:predicted ATPase